MVLKSSLVACLFAGVAITQALPSGFRPSHMDKRHKAAPPTLVAEASKLPPEQQTIMCILNYIFTAPKNDDDQLTYQALIDGCKDAVAKSAAQPLAPAPESQQGPVDTLKPDPAARLAPPFAPDSAPVEQQTPKDSSEPSKAGPGPNPDPSQPAPDAPASENPASADTTPQQAPNGSGPNPDPSQPDPSQPAPDAPAPENPAGAGTTTTDTEAKNGKGKD